MKTPAIPKTKGGEADEETHLSKTWGVNPMAHASPPTSKPMVTTQKSKGLKSNI